MTVSIGELMWTSVKAVLPVFLILGAGAWGVRKGIFDERSSATLSWLSKWVYAPSLLFVRLGSGLSRELFAEVWVLAVMGVIIIAFNFLVAILLVFVGKPTKSFRRWYIFALTFPNITALPLVFISAICAEGNIRKPSYYTSSTNPNSPYFTSDECVTQGQLYLFIYIIFPDMMMYATASVLSAAERTRDSGEDEAEVLKNKPTNASSSAALEVPEEDGPRASHQQHTSVPVLETRRQSEVEDVGGELALPPPPQLSSSSSSSSPSRYSSPPTSPVMPTRTRNLVPDPAPVPEPATASSSSSSLSGPLEADQQHVGRNESSARDGEEEPLTWREKFKWTIIVIKSIIQPPVMAMILSVIVGVIPPLQSWIFSENTPATPFVAVLEYFAPGLLSVVTLALALLIGNKMVKTRYSELLGGDEAAMGISRRTLFTFVFGRTIFIPGVTFALIYAALDVFPKDQLLLTILFFEAFVPTANMCAICAPPEQGQIISLGQINQYIVGIFSMTMWCFAALTITTAATDPSS